MCAASILVFVPEGWVSMFLRIISYFLPNSIASYLEDRTFSIPHHDKFRSHAIKEFRGVEYFGRNIGLYENAVIVPCSNHSI
jgi:hypothetical protein